jgi:hypothetical protein
MILAYNSGMANQLVSIGKKSFCIVAIAVVSAACLGLSFSQSAMAAQLGQRSLQLSDVTPGATAQHTFTFSYATLGTDVGSLIFEYCTSPLPEIACDAPAGLNASGVSLIQQTGETGFFILSAQSNRITLTRASVQPPTNNPSQYTFSNVNNPTGAPRTFYVRISSFASIDGSGTATDFGAVVNSTVQGVQVSSEVPPYLKFCVGLSIADDCTTAEGNLVDLGDMSTSHASSGTSQMMAATNADFGLAIAMYGTTLTSGNNIVPALTSPTVSAPGNAQFGINLRANTDPPGGQNPTGGGITYPMTRYNVPNRYAFANGDTIATSPDVTDTRKLTVSYLANISPAQPPGVYTATLTYICTATF